MKEQLNIFKYYLKILIKWNHNNYKLNEIVIKMHVPLSQIICAKIHYQIQQVLHIFNYVHK